MYIEKLLASKKTVFSMSDFRIAWKIDDPAYLKTAVNRLFRRGAIKRIYRGLYAVGDTYDRLECANKLKTPSYVSLETVLAKENIIFQNYGNDIYSVSNNTVVKVIGSQRFLYKKISNKILTNPKGLRTEGMAVVASKERAICDRLYLSPRYAFDNLRSVDWDVLKELSGIYNKRVQREIKNLTRTHYAQ